MSEGQESPQADQRTTLVVHDQLVQRSLEAVDLLLDSRDDALNLGHSFRGICT